MEPPPPLEFDTAVVRLKRGGGFTVVLALAVVGLGGYLAVTRSSRVSGWLASLTQQGAEVPAGGSVAAPKAEAPARAIPSAPAMPLAPATAPAATAPAASPVVAAPPNTSPPAPSAATAAPDREAVVAGAAVSAKGDEAASVVARRAPPEGQTVKTDEKSYDRIIAEADRLLENGRTDHAQKLYERALRIRPDAVEGIVGLGYVMLDRGRVPLAIAHFKRALASGPNASALFGIAEAYRSGGQIAQALEHYQRYVAESPSGPDAPAARRQAQLLEAPVAAPPASGPPATPSTVLQEGAAQP
jgi:hypothetical protein